MITGRRLAALTLLVMLMSASVAMADETSFADDDDASGRFDIATYSATHGEQEPSSYPVLQHTVSMYESWEPDDADRNSNQLALIFDLGNDGIGDRKLTLGANGDGSLYARVTQSSSNGASLRGYARVWRDDDHSFTVVFPRRLLKRGIHEYRWRVSSIYSHPDDEICSGNAKPPDDVSHYCYDFAPGDGGWVTHDLRD